MRICRSLILPGLAQKLIETGRSGWRIAALMLIATAPYSAAQAANAKAAVLTPGFAQLVSIGQPLADARTDLIDTAAASGLTTFVALLTELGMAEDLRGYGRFTVFAPTDSAFAAVPVAVSQALEGNRELAAKILAYHVVVSGSPLTAEQIQTPTTLTTSERSSLQVTRRRGRLFVNDARVVEADITASNGVIHAIDRVLIPADVLEQIR